MKKTRKVSITLSGVEASPLNDGKMDCECLYVYNTPMEYNSVVQKKFSYEKLLEDPNATPPTLRYNLKPNNPILLNYEKDEKYHVDQNNVGPYFRASNFNNFVFYKREYKKYHKFNGYIEKDGIKTPQYTDYELKGSWQPVSLENENLYFRDYNIRNNHSYQYIAYPRAISVSNRQQFANQDSPELEAITGQPVEVNWNCWSLIELLPVKMEKQIPLAKHCYKVDSDNIWLFKYNLDVGAQTQNITKSEIQTLGQYSHFAQGLTNAVSGEVTCLLGSEIIPYSKNGYIERQRQSIAQPLHTNERVALLNQWRKLVYSRNPKLLRDQKGQAWIVQILSSSNTPYNSVLNQPDSIHFAWKEIESTDNIMIYGDGDPIDQDYNKNISWTPIK